MSRTAPRTANCFMAVAAALATTFSCGAYAQSTGSQEISVIAPQVSVSLDKKRDAGQQRVRIYSVQRRVSFADLDLRSDADADRFRQRIRDAAQGGCNAISKKYPNIRDDSCLNTAIGNAMVQADQVIAAAKR